MGWRCAALSLDAVAATMPECGGPDRSPVPGRIVMQFIATEIAGVVVIEPKVFEDERGFFMETFHQPRFATNGIELPFVQDNHSRSKRGVLRGLHYQLRYPQGKLVRVVRGEIFDVAVDLRRS